MPWLNASKMHVREMPMVTKLGGRGHDDNNSIELGTDTGVSDKLESELTYSPGRGTRRCSQSTFRLAAEHTTGPA